MKFVVPQYKGENKGHYSPGIISNGLLFISGQLSIDPDTRQVAQGGIEEQRKQEKKDIIFGRKIYLKQKKK